MPNLTEMPEFDFNLFIHQANVSYFNLDFNDSQRYGQFLMNYISQNHPDIVVPENANCFYDNGKVPRFLRFLHSLT